MILHTENINNKVKSGLYIVSTPIGNLSDITLRALEVLKKSDYVLCEDTRISKNLLERYEIKSKLIANHKFNEKKNLSKVIDILKSGSVVSLISDAGTPSISDPGAILVNECVVNEIDIFPIPGASAVSSAVSISGFNEKYFFYGFFPEKNSKLSEDFERLANLEGCIVFFISPRKFNRSIKDLKRYFSNRKILVCREMTKFYEEYIRTDVETLEPFKSDPKGELTIVISEKVKEKNSSIILKESDKIIIQKLIKKLSIKDITDLISQNTNVSKKEIYNYCLKIKNEK
ncbi:16S rRNA (cytidine(1402)-2'-O)-methyltransferase [Candidatus Pelagibacter ubique]|jgi:16S rRNA (cytidine1402-2'-O)-methyltransferase|nr:16S rRNA (cytidine(1402)-2'-O)-methyltransferase [Candidatus Pelagibacter bacterium]MDA7444790.1 16S rRNA (cytidine(1402)-2'-O)-methyltransferase [Candidatus Pelagibacter ubique]MDA7452274.1 16S rRNA (cytidine(1402)-2'-O)-methyltransferase [Candidatus Pelagibacter ubique]MDA8845921.1 16S rRNA (cytidine(1402)-2'-O)-methyltransferase [Candidatus Pelagibacter bacterium]MDC0372250.1 16S rRNA (cytidine(1402)-2'-O)-methyltransferase [Candidatus Pelagibacter ubique]